jgi:hypothetical protein
MKALHELALEVLSEVRRWAGDGVPRDTDKTWAVVAADEAVDGVEAARVALDIATAGAEAPTVRH